MKRILHVVSCLGRGGTEAFIMNHYRVLDRSRFQFDFLVLHEKEYPYAEEIRALGGNIYFVTAPSLRNVGRFLAEAVALLREKGPYCAVHSHVNIENAWIMVAAAKAAVPVRISHSHDTTGKEGSVPVRIYRGIQEWLIKRYATDFLACSEDAGVYLYGRNFFGAKGKVLHNGIDVEQFINVSDADVERLRKEFGLPAGTGPIIGNITRFEAKKNQLFALEVFRRVLEKSHGAVLILGGPDGGDLEKVKARAQELGMTDHVRFIGSRGDIPACLKMLDVYLFPSLYEGLGIVLLEAQAAGCFCVASTGVSRETDMGLGKVWFLELSDPAESWAACIMDNSGCRQKDPEEIRNAFAWKGYSIRQSAQELMKIYDQR